MLSAQIERKISEYKRASYRQIVQCKTDPGIFLTLLAGPLGQITVWCAQLTRDLLAIVKFLVIVML